MSGDSTSSSSNTPQSKRELLEKLLREKVAQKQPVTSETQSSISVRTAQDPIRPVDRSREHYPLSFAQRRMWLLDQLEPGNPAYNLSISIRLRGKLRGDALIDSIAEVIRRHETLRTTFVMVEDEPAQIIHAPFKLSVPVVSVAAEEPDLHKLIREEASRPFDLVHGPLLRAKLLKLNESEHLFIFTCHHIIADGWSIVVFVRELQALYRTFVNGQVSPLADLPVQYIDFAHWQEEWLQGNVLESQLGYWKKQLAAPLPVLDLPFDYARPKTQTFNGARETVTLSESLSSALKELSRKAGCTMFMTLLGACSVLLYRQTGQADIVVGSPIAGRHRTELEGMIGFFINTLVMRVNLDGDPTFHELIQHVREVSLQAYANQDVPFERLLEELNPERHLNRTPVFQVFFNMLNFNDAPLDFADLKAEYVQSDTEARFDLTIYAREENKRINFNLVYNSDLFSQERMIEMGRQLELLLEQIVKAPDHSLQKFTLLTPASAPKLPDPRHPLKVQWFGSVHSRLTEKAAEHPNHLAIIDPAGCWSYGDLESRSNRLAHFLIQGGIRRQDVVAIYARRSASLVWAILGVLKAGAAFLILDPAYPAERLAKHIFLARPRGFINLELDTSLPAAVEASLQSLEVAPASHLHWDEDLLALLSEYSDQNPALSIDPDDIAYVIFTSGSTGQPKGIVGTHRPLSHFFNWYTRIFNVQALDRFSMLSGLAHDPLLRDIFAPLGLGATLVIPEPEKLLVPGYLLSWMHEHQISVTHLTPAIEQLILDTVSDTQELRLESLRYAFFGGETLDQRHIDSLRRVAPVVTCVNFYGATETPQAMAYSIIHTSDSEALASPRQHKETVPIGRGIDDVQLLVLGKSDQRAGIGEVGEICIRTPYLSQGYLDNAPLTAERFLTNPFTGNPVDRIYKTGDRGRYLPGGDVEFMGRNDNQVKIRGLRIELGEIESTLRNHPAVRQAVVRLWQVHADDKRLVAYIVPNAMQFPRTHELNGYLQRYLPPYTIPARYILIDSVPLTPNGKVDFRTLPEPDLQAQYDIEFHAPQTQLQELLAEIWADVLRQEKIGIHDNFFQLGGHSLLATQIMSRVRRMMHVELPLRVLFESPTVESLADAIESVQKTSAVAFDIPPLRAHVHEKAARLSFSQERMWFIHQLAPESAAYNMPGVLHISGELDTFVAEQAFNKLIERHAVLRTTFDLADGIPVQLIAPEKTIRVPVYDLQSLSEAEQQLRVRELIRTSTKTPFDLVAGPLLRIGLVKLGGQEHILIVCMHHIISDQWSGGILLREFGAIYNALSTNSPVALEPLPIQYVDYALWQRDWLKGDTLQAKLAFWRKQLDGISVLDLPTDFPRPAMVTFHGAYEKLPLAASTLNAIHTLCRQEQITPFMFFLGIFKIMLLRYSGQQDVAVGSPIANRNWFEVEPLIGTFVNTVVLRTRLDDNPTLREFLYQIRNISLDAFNHQDFPFEKLIEELQPERDLSHAPLVQVLFNVQNAPVSMPALHGDLVIAPLLPEERDAQFDITLSITTDIVPNMIVTYNTDLFKRDTALRMLRHLEILTQDALRNPDRPVFDLEMLTPEEREQQLLAWNDTWLEYPRSSSVHELVERQAEKTPDAIAVQFIDEQLTYRELNARANQLAHHLRERGVTTETTVGISMERSAEMVVGLLGILKAGGTYIPLDPMFPRERLEYMLEFSETAFLLTHEQPRAKATSDLLQRDNLAVVNLDSDWHIISRCPNGNLNLDTDPEQLAYIIFTSGSTGKPKGVQIPHRAVVNFLTSMQQLPGMTPGDRLLSVTTLSFDISVLEVFLPLISGACVVVLPGDAVYDGAALMRHLETSDITVMQATPATWQMLVEAGWSGDKHLKVLCGGEAMPQDLARWLTHHVNAVWNMYGPTETTVWSTICEILPATDAITIGRPIANTRIYILDKNMEPVPVNVAGELYIAGDGVARGYLKQPELTAEKFVPETFHAGHRLMYRTGDQARYLSDGRIAFLGRADFQVKIRGYRIELGEIESVLDQHSAIRQAVVVAREDTPGDKRLVAYLIMEMGQRIDIGELRQFVREKLPDYMVPSAFVFLDEFPMTPNRKVNRKALPAPDDLAVSRQKQFVAPRDEIEQTIARIIADILHLEHVGVYDSFFDLGGHSLLATQVLSRMKEKFPVQISLRDFFMAPTVAEVSEWIKTVLWAKQNHSEIWDSTGSGREEMKL